MYLVDSPVYIDLLRTRTDPAIALRPWVASDEILTCGIIRCEVLRGILSRKAHTRMVDLFRVLVEAPLSAGFWSETARLAWRLDRKGIVLPLTDLAIAECAIQYHATVVTSDRHFRLIPGVKVRAGLPAIT